VLQSARLQVTSCDEHCDQWQLSSTEEGLSGKWKAQVCWHSSLSFSDSGYMSGPGVLRHGHSSEEIGMQGELDEFLETLGATDDAHKSPALIFFLIID